MYVSLNIRQFSLGPLESASVSTFDGHRFVASLKDSGSPDEEIASVSTHQEFPKAM